MSWTYLDLESLIKVGCGYFSSLFLINGDALNLLKEKKPNEYNITIYGINFSNASPTQLKITFGLFRHLAKLKIERHHMSKTVNVLSTTKSSALQK